jgi:nitroreductase
MSDTALATIQYMIEAHSLGLGTCWAGVIGSSVEQQMKEILGIPKHLNILALVATGYAAEQPTKTRKELNSLVHYEKY